MEINRKKQSFHSLLTAISILLHFCAEANKAQDGYLGEEFHVAVILDMGSLEWEIVHSCMSMAIYDFYNLHNDYATRVVLHARDTKGEPLRALHAGFYPFKSSWVFLTQGRWLLVCYYALWRKIIHTNDSNLGAMAPGASGVWAYDVCWSLAHAAERVRYKAPVRRNPENNLNLWDSDNITTARLGPLLLKEILESGVQGLSGVISNLNFEDYRLRPYTLDGYAEALSRGSKNGGVSAIIDEMPYLKIFLSKYAGDGYSIAGHVASTNGFGFVFPKGSPLVPEISRQIMALREEGKLRRMESAWFPNQSPLLNDGSVTSNNLNALNLDNFGGLFIITGSTSCLAVLLFFIFKLHKQWQVLRNYDLHYLVQKGYEVVNTCVKGRIRSSAQERGVI
ncbi:glutamate receptor 1.3-like [Tripterygium wilfordii]|uniref:Glutamate receptor 1.3-like n=1 Tax=Tripterygium wilfordii TaxID=458696 RepID=A0A7J7D4P8_TRIWF|nr:glutamate receptor 1.3-like [Tripterygium wilfordii]